MINMTLEYYDLERLLNSYDFINEWEAKIIADYLDESGGDLNFTQYVWNVIPFFTICLEGGKKEAIQYIEENLCCDIEDCVIHEVNLLNGVYLEWS